MKNLRVNFLTVKTMINCFETIINHRESVVYYGENGKKVEQRLNTAPKQSQKGPSELPSPGQKKNRKRR